MTKALNFTKAGLKRAIQAALECGLLVTGIQPDGTLLLSAGGTVTFTKTHDHNPSPFDPNEWAYVEA